MKNKELIWVVLTGLLVALGVTIFIYFTSDDGEPLNLTPSPTPTPITTLPDQITDPLALIHPENETVFEEKALTITGQTFPNLPVVILINSKDFFTTSNDQGQFSLDINLESGSNLIIATTIDDQGQTYSDQRLVVYTNKSLEETLVTDEEVIQADDNAQDDSTGASTSGN